MFIPVMYRNYGLDLSENQVFMFVDEESGQLTIKKGDDDFVELGQVFESQGE